MRTPAGTWLGNYPVLPLNVERINRSLRRIIKGLYYARGGVPFPKLGHIEIIGNPTLAVMKVFEQNLDDALFSFGDTVFEWEFTADANGTTLWKLIFYRSVVFYAIAIENPERMESEPAGLLLDSPKD